MNLSKTNLEGVYLLELTRHQDNRGYFVDFWNSKEFATMGLESDFQQTSLSQNLARGTLRGLHYQKSPKQQTKLVTCIKGRIFDVAVDLRRDSPTFGKWESFELSEQNGRALYIPKNFAHGFITLERDSSVLYGITEPYAKQLSAGVRWNDPNLNITWPSRSPVVSERDKNLPEFDPEEFK